MLKNYRSIDITKNLLRIITTLFLVNFPLSFFVLLITVVQTSLTKNNILNIYSSGLFFTYNKTKELTNKLTTIIVFYFLLQFL